MTIQFGECGEGTEPDNLRIGPCRLQHRQKASEVRQAPTKPKAHTAGHTRIAYVLRAPQSTATRHIGRLLLGGRAYPCALGLAGIAGLKQEGDGATPRALMPVLAGRFRADRVIRPTGSSSFWSRIEPTDGWNDAPFTPAYNQPVTLPHRASHEVMTREDHLYDRLIILDWNMRIRSQGRGSAIFFHQSRLIDGAMQGTQGCIALAPQIFEKLTPQLARLHAIKVV